MCHGRSQRRSLQDDMMPINSVDRHPHCRLPAVAKPGRKANIIGMSRIGFGCIVIWLFIGCAAAWGCSDAPSTQEDEDEVIAECTEAIRRNPMDTDAYIKRARFLVKKGEIDKALADFSEVIRLNTKIAVAYVGRGWVWEIKKRYAKAIADYSEAVRINRSDTISRNNFAWLLATCPDAKLRDGRKAVELATKACELNQWKSPDLIDTLAAAYAEAGTSIRQ